MSELVEKFELQKGDFVVITGDFNKFILSQKRVDKNYNPNTLINQIINRIGNSGTLMFQTFSWDFCHGLGFDIKRSKSKTGALGNLALKRDDFKRTKHPIYSFAVYGKAQNELANLNNSDSFGKDSPFALMHQNKAKMIVVNLELNHSFTFVHYAEQSCGIDYRFNKEFKGEYIDENGVKSEKTYSMFVRKEGVFTELKELECEFLKQKTMKINIFLDNEIKIIDLKTAYDIIKNDILNNAAKSLHYVI